MLQDAFDKLTVGSTVSLNNFPQLEGTVVGINGNNVIVDFPPNNTTHSDPDPMPIHYFNLGVVNYASNLAPDFKEEVKKALNKWTMYSQDLHNEIAEFMNIWKL